MASGAIAEGMNRKRFSSSTNGVEDLSLGFRRRGYPGSA